MTQKMETTTVGSATVVDGIKPKETIHPIVTTNAKHLIGWRLVAERERADALRFADEFAASMSFWRERGEHKLAGHAVLRYLRLLLAG